MNKPVLKQTLIEDIKTLDQMVAKAQSYTIDGQQPEFLRQIVLKLTEAIMWMTQSVGLLTELERQQNDKQGKEN